MSLARAFCLATLVFLPALAHAEDGMYVGLSATTPGEYYADFGSASHVQNQNTVHAFKLYGGVNLNPHLALEGGYGAFGTWKVSDPTPGSTASTEASSKLFYVAARSQAAVSESVSVIGKLGLAHNSLEVTGTGKAARDTSALRLMLGTGVSYSFNPKLSAVVEFNYYGKSKDSNFTQQKLEAGLRYHF